MKLLKAKRRLICKPEHGEQGPIHIERDHLVPCMSETDTKYLIYCNGETFEKSKNSFEDIGIDVPQYVTMFSYDKTRKIIEVLKYAQEKGFTISHETLGNIGRDDQGYSVSRDMEEAIKKNVQKQLVFCDRESMSVFPDTECFERDGHCVIRYSKDTQTLAVDFFYMKPEDPEFVDTLNRFIQEFEELTEEEKNEIFFKRMTEQWTKELKEQYRQKERELRDYKDRSKQLELELTQSFANIRNTINSMRVMEKIIESDSEDIGKRLAEVRTLGFVKDTSFEESTLVVHCGNIPVKFDDGKGNKYPYVFNNVRIFMQPKRIWLDHDSKTSEGVLHPHISGQGPGQSICFGDQAGKVHRALGEQDFKQAVFRVRMLLDCYTPGDNYTNLETFLVDAGAAKFKDGVLVSTLKEDRQTKIIEEEM